MLFHQQEKIPHVHASLHFLLHVFISHYSLAPEIIKSYTVEELLYKRVNYYYFVEDVFLPHVTDVAVTANEGLVWIVLTQWRLISPSFSIW